MEGHRVPGQGNAAGTALQSGNQGIRPEPRIRLVVIRHCCKQLALHIRRKRRRRRNLPVRTDPFEAKAAPARMRHGCYFAWDLICATASLKPPEVKEEPATLETLSSSMSLPTICAAIPLAISPWNFLVLGLEGGTALFTASTLSPASVSSTPTVSSPFGDVYVPSAVYVPSLYVESPFPAEVEEEGLPVEAWPPFWVAGVWVDGASVVGAQPAAVPIMETLANPT